MKMVTAQSLKHAQLDLGLQELLGGGSKLYIQNRKRNRCQWPLALCGYQDSSPLVKLQPSRRQIQRSCCFWENSGPCWEVPWSVHTGRSSRATSPPRQCHQDIVAPAQAPKEASPSIPPGPKAFSFPPEGCFHFSPGKEPTSSRTEVPPAPAQPQQLQAWLGMEMCSCHRNSSPEPAFGYQPWVWFEILPEENLHPLAEPSSLSHQLQPFSVLQFQCTPSRRSTSSSSLTPQQKPDWPQISPEPVPELYFHCSPPSKRRAGEIICEKADPEPCEPSSPLLCPFSHQPGGR